MSFHKAGVEFDYSPTSLYRQFTATLRKNRKRVKKHKPMGWKASVNRKIFEVVVAERRLDGIIGKWGLISGQNLVCLIVKTL